MAPTILSADMQFDGDNGPTGFWINGTFYLESLMWNSGPETFAIPPAELNACGKNVIGAMVTDGAGTTGVTWQLAVHWSDGTTTYIVSDASDNSIRMGYVGIKGSVVYPPDNPVCWSCPGYIGAEPDCTHAGWSLSYNTRNPEGTCPSPTRGQYVGYPTIPYPPPGSGTVPWIYVGDCYGVIGNNDTWIYRQIFGLGPPACNPTPTPCPGPPVATATQIVITNRTPPPTVGNPPGASNTSTITPSATPSRTATQTRTSTATSSPTQTGTSTRTLSPTNTATLSASASPTPTPTGTQSPTSTASPSRTGTPTLTASASPTPTATQTPTRTGTPTLTPSASPTPTATGTVSSTGTPTFTASASATPTATQTLTRTGTPTLTASASPTPTATGTVSSTGTPTFTASASATPTATGTVSRTATPTFTASASATPTATGTVSRTSTPTFTASATTTPTSTGTVSSSSTPSYTATPTETGTKTATLTITESSTTTSGPSPTSTDTPTSTFTPSDTPTVTDTPTDTLTSSPSVSPTPTLTATGTSTETPTFSYTLTSTNTSTLSPVPSATVTATATLTVSPQYSLTQTLTFSASPTPKPAAPFTASVKVYNSAGELVAVLYDQLPLYKMPMGLKAVTPSFLPDEGGAGALELLGPDLPLIWTGASASGQLVGSGLYNIVVQATDPFGSVNSWTSTLTVLRSDTSTVVEVYNSAGEMVWHQRGAAKAPGTVGVSGRELVPAASGSDSLKISFGSDPADVFTWDGRGSQGQALSSGTYIVKVTQAGSGGKATFDFSVTLLQANTNVFGWIAAAPNPVPMGTRSIMVSLQQAAPGIVAWGEAYNLAGEHVGSLTAVLGGDLRWNIPDSLAPGVYLLQISARDSLGKLKSAPVKIALVR